MPASRSARPLLQSPVAVEGVALLRATLRLWPDRLEVEGRFRSLGPFRLHVALGDIQTVEWNTLADTANLVVHRSGEPLALTVREAATWKFAIEEAMVAAGLPALGLPSRHFRDERLRQMSKPSVETKASKPPPVSPAAKRPVSEPTARPDDLSVLVGATVHALHTDDAGGVRLSLRLPDGSPLALPLARLELRLTLENHALHAARDGVADRGDGQVSTEHVYDTPLPTLTVTPRA